jgi:hypothetical protein
LGVRGFYWQQEIHLSEGSNLHDDFTATPEKNAAILQFPNSKACFSHKKYNI